MRSQLAIPTAISGLLALTAATTRPWLCPDALVELWTWLWCGTAVLSGLLTSAVATRRVLSRTHLLSIANARLAVVQFCPGLLLGSIVT